MRVALRAVVWPELRASVLPLLEQEDRRADGLRNDDLSDAMRVSLAKMSVKLRDALSDDDIAEMTVRAGRGVDRAHRADFYRRLAKATGVNALVGEPFRGAMIQQWSQRNTDLIRSIRDSVVPGIRKDIDAAFVSGARHEVLRKRWREQGLPLNFGTLEGSTKVIARDQIASLNGPLTQARQQAVGIRHYIWRASGDERVRDLHDEYNGQRFSWDDPPEDGHPGEAVQCRCVAEAVIDISEIERRASLAPGLSSPPPIAARGPLLTPPTPTTAL